MDRISYFKLQAKNLMRDFKTKKWKKEMSFILILHSFLKI